MSDCVRDVDANCFNLNPFSSHSENYKDGGQSDLSKESKRKTSP